MIANRQAEEKEATAIILADDPCAGRYAKVVKKAGAVAYMVKDLAINNLVPVIRAALESALATSTLGITVQ